MAAIVAAGAGFVAGRSIKSPADAAADAEAPEPSLITVPVELRELASNVVTRGDARREGSVQISVDASAGASSGGVAVVTGVTAPAGEVIEEGSVLVEVSERPVIALQGQLPMFRSLGPGSRGDDVTQLQDALVRIGIEVPVDGFFGEETERAVEQLYVRVGYSAPGLTDDERAQLDAARESLDGAQASLNAASASLAELQAPLPESQRLQADASLAAAEDAVELAEASATEANALAEADLAARKVERTDAQEAADLAATRLAEAEAGIHPDTGVALGHQRAVRSRQRRLDGDVGPAHRHDRGTADDVAAFDVETLHLGRHRLDEHDLGERQPHAGSTLDLVDLDGRSIPGPSGVGDRLRRRPGVGRRQQFFVLGSGDLEL